MQFDKSNSWYSTTVRPDDTARTSVMRYGDAPDEEDRAITDAIRLANFLPLGADLDQYFEVNYATAPSPFRDMVRRFFLDEVRYRTVPGAHREPISAPPGAEGGDASAAPVVNQTEPGPGPGVDGAAVSPARASIEDEPPYPAPDGMWWGTVRGRWVLYGAEEQTL